MFVVHGFAFRQAFNYDWADRSGTELQLVGQIESGLDRRYPSQNFQWNSIVSPSKYLWPRVDFWEKYFLLCEQREISPSVSTIALENLALTAEMLVYVLLWQRLQLTDSFNNG
ncbi:hypothetical protein LSTR_LSTR013757 [Laodelphax striatellus]|uniref:Uncharacterized protein n=1 Tax=Laodelphax striatellus TaxID=195883 RepID=A0A482WKQ5_LAOST|nr:hypothetical protein LSTR_LSTR013757 [Laodelphax striatellus]